MHRIQCYQYKYIKANMHLSFLHVLPGENASSVDSYSFIDSLVNVYVRNRQINTGTNTTFRFDDKVDTRTKDSVHF